LWVYSNLEFVSDVTDVIFKAVTLDLGNEGDREVKLRR
jgi:hypothetical protein